MTDRSGMLTIAIQNAFPFARWRMEITARWSHISVHSIEEPSVIIHHFNGARTRFWAALTADQMIEAIDGWFERGEVPRWLLDAKRAHKAREEAIALARIIPVVESKKKDSRL